MNDIPRRAFLKFASVIPGLPFINSIPQKNDIGVPEPKPAHYFDWGGPFGPYTTDPELKNKIIAHPDNVIYLNGVILKFPVTRMMTGPNGWVEQLVLEPITLRNGMSTTRCKYDEHGNTIKEIAYGDVTYKLILVDDVFEKKKPLRTSCTKIWTGEVDNDIHNPDNWMRRSQPFKVTFSPEKE